MTQRLEKLTDVAVILAGLSAAVSAVVLVAQRLPISDPSTEITSVEVVEDWEKYATKGHRIGSATASVTIVEFGDYQCPYCRELQPHVEAILAKYPDDVAFVFRHFPLDAGGLSYAAARAAECAGEQGRFWGFHRQLLGNPNWVGSAMRQFATVAGVQDMDAFEGCMDDQSPVPAIEEDLAAALELGAQGTPAILINGTMSYGVVDSLQLQAVVQRILP